MSESTIRLRSLPKLALDQEMFFASKKHHPGLRRFDRSKFKYFVDLCGFSLIEILIAVFILTFGLLGIAGLYINSLKRTENAYWHTHATSIWTSVLEQKSLGNDYLDCELECKNLLPHGDCKLQSGKVTICWRGKYNRQCI